MAFSASLFSHLLVLGLVFDYYPLDLSNTLCFSYFFSTRLRLNHGTAHLFDAHSLLILGNASLLFPLHIFTPSSYPQSFVSTYRICSQQYILLSPCLLHVVLTTLPISSLSRMIRLR
jgi:hypothetical protein